MATEYFKFMVSPDTYRTIKSISRGIFKEKGSKFISIAFPVRNEDEIRKYLDETRKEFHDARHHCYAYALGKSGSDWRATDDGEPSGTGGKPILGQIRSFGVTNVLIIVPRYFGGTLLGTSGLINAYKTAAESALSNAEIIDHIMQQKCELTFPYQSMNEVMKIIKDEGIVQTGHSFDLNCSISAHFRSSDTEKIRAKFSRIDEVTVKFLEIE